MPLGSESSSLQRAFVRYAVAAGWTYLPLDDVLALRHGDVTSPVLERVLVAQLQQLNLRVLDAAKAADVVKRLVRVQYRVCRSILQRNPSDVDQALFPARIRP